METKKERKGNEKGTRPERKGNEKGTRPERKGNETETRPERDRDEKGTKPECIFFFDVHGTTEPPRRNRKERRKERGTEISEKNEEGRGTRKKD